MARYDVDLYVTGYIKADSDIEAEEIAEEISRQIIASSDLFFANVEVEGVYRRDDLPELTDS